jgi:predicted transcriptional regulator of viral defense system
MRKQDKTKRVAQIAKRMGILRPRDLDAYDISRTYLRRANEQGLIKRIGRGLYIPQDAEVTEHYTLAEACKIVPNGT